MKIIASKTGQGKTTELIRQFLQKEGAVLLSAEITEDEIIDKIAYNEFETPYEDNKILYIPEYCSAGLEDLEILELTILSNNINDTTIFLDGMNLLTNNSLSEIRNLIYPHNLDLVMTVPCNRHAPDGVQMMDI